MGKDNRNSHKNRSHKQRGGHKPYQKDGSKGQRSNRNEHHRHDNRRPHNGKHEFVPKASLREDEVGITEYVSATAGFTGVIKSRFSDFHVNEINKQGKVLQLSDLKIPQPVDDTLNAEELETAREELNAVITTVQWEKIRVLAEAKEGEAIELEVTALDKEKRTHIHKVLKQLYAGKLVSSTVSTEAPAVEGEAALVADAEKKFIKIMKPTGGRDRNRTQWTFGGEFVHFLMHKENMDTSEVAVAMADRMNLRPSQVNYCGTKDKRAKTTQMFCIKRRTPSQIVGSVKALPNVHVGNFDFSNEVLKLGDLKGNRFRIALRHVSGEQAAIEVDLEALRTSGFINYYGLQRFGNCATIPTWMVGVALLKSDYKTACELILKPRDNDVPFMRAIRETWWKERNSAAAAAQFRTDKFIEKKLLDGLAQYGEHDYASALRKIPRNMLLLYPHAFQSLVFNRIVSRRIAEFGLKLMVGDLVYRNKDELDSDSSEAVMAATIDEGEEGEQEEKVADDEPTASEEESVFKRKVKALTEEDIAGGSYTLFDVVLPLPGYDVTYPDNAVAQWYEALLQEHGLESNALRHNVKTYALAGAYRKMLIQPTEMSWHFRYYDNAESALIASDWEVLKGRDLPAAPKSGKFKALVLDFCLPTAAYATMLLRELLKTDTSAKSQISLEQCEKQKATEGETDKEAEGSATKAEKRKITAVGKAEEVGEAVKEVAEEDEGAAKAKLQKMNEEPASN